MKKKSLKSNLIWNSVGSFVYLFCQWLLTLLIVRFSKNFSDAGNFSLAISITNIFYNIACFNVRPYLVSDNTNEYSVDNYTTFRFVTIFLSIIMCAIYLLFFNYSVSQFVCIMLYMMLKVCEAIVDLLHAFEQRKSRMDIGGFSLLCRGIITVVIFTISFLLIHNLNISLVFMVLCNFIFIIIYDFQRVKSFEVLKIYFDKDKIVSLFLRFLPIAVGTFLGTMSTSLPRQILEKMNGSDMLGIYATIATPAVIVQVASTYIFNPLLVTFSDYRLKRNFNDFKTLFFKVSSIIILFAIFCYVGQLFLAKPVLGLLYGAKIKKYSYLFNLIIIYTSLNGYMWFCYNILIIFREIKAILLINIISFLICISTSKLFITYFGMNGVSYTLITFTIVSIVLMLMVIKKSLMGLRRCS